MTLAAALAKRFWKLTGLSDGVWEEGKISPRAPPAGLCSGFVFCSVFLLLATGLIQRTLKWE